MSVETSILLPTASVHFFLKDKETVESANALQDDWRFARVEITVTEGNVDSSIKTYQDSQSPSLIVVETESTDESFVKKLEALAEVCNEGTNAIVVGPVNDIELYRNLTSMGVTDYLVKPVPIETLSEIIASSLISKLGTIGSRLIGVVGAKGGVGTSSLTQAMAWGISEQLNQKTILLDAAGGWSTLSVAMGSEPMTTLHEAVRAASDEDEDALARMLFKPNEKLSVLAVGGEPMLEASPHAQKFESLLDMVMKSYPVVLVDLSGAIPSLKKAVIDRAHELVVVSTPTLPALRATRSLLQEVNDLKGDQENNVDLVINMQGMMASKEVSNKDISAVLEKKPSVTIPYDAKLFIASENDGKKLSDNPAGKEVINKLLAVTDTIIASDNKKSKSEKSDSLVGGFINKLSGK